MFVFNLTSYSGICAARLQVGNDGAFVRFEAGTDMQPVFTKFDAVPHPAVAPLSYMLPSW